MTLLHAAVKYGDIAKVQFLAELKHFDVEELDTVILF